MKNKTGLVYLGIAASFITIPFLANESGLRINTTGSAPTGLWITSNPVAIHRGALVSICPPDMPVVRALVAARPLYRGDCETGSVDLLKPIAALPGDTIIVGGGNVIINGTELPNTTPKIPALAVANGEYVVGKDETWVFSTYASDSFDSRYFGPVPIANIRGTAIPVLVNGDPANMTRRAEHD